MVSFVQLPFPFLLIPGEVPFPTPPDGRTLAEFLLGRTSSFSVITELFNAQSSGRVFLNSSDPVDPLLIDHRYLEAPEDLRKMKNCIKLSNKIFSTPPISASVIGKSVDADDDEAPEDAALQERFKKLANIIKG